VRPVKEIHGHTLSEVFVGGLLGFFIALAFNTL
jgi:acid phosphatase family membrane protein YuiD